MTRPYGPDDFAQHQDAIARWSGFPDAAAMNAVHDLGIVAPSALELRAWGRSLRALIVLVPRPAAQ